MASRQHFNPRRFRNQIDPNLLRKEKHDRVTMLFDRIKKIEHANRIQGTAKTGEEMDENLKQEAPILDIVTAAPTAETKTDKEDKPDIAECKEMPGKEDPAYYIASNNRLSSILEYEDIMVKYLDMIEQAVDQYSYCNSKLTEVNKEVQDFLHELRMPRKTAEEGFKLYQLGHNLEIKRQGYKDAIAVLEPIVKHAKKVEDQKENIKHTIQYLRESRISRDNRIYMPRSDLKLSVGDKFRALSPEEQETMKKNLEKGKKAS